MPVNAYFPVLFDRFVKRQTIDATLFYFYVSKPVNNTETPTGQHIYSIILQIGKYIQNQTHFFISFVGNFGGTCKRMKSEALQCLREL